MSVRGMAAGYVQQLNPVFRAQHPSPSPRLLQAPPAQAPPWLGPGPVPMSAPSSAAMHSDDVALQAPSDAASMGTVALDATQVAARVEAAQRLRAQAQAQRPSPGYASTAASATAAIVQDMTNWIPTEIVAAYIAMVAVFYPQNMPNACTWLAWPPRGDSPADALWLAIIAGACASPLAVYFVARYQARTQHKRFTGAPGFMMFASFVAFITLANYLPGSMISLCLGEKAGTPLLYLIGIQVLLYLTALGLAAFGRLDVPLQLAAVFASTGFAMGAMTAGSGVDDDDDTGPTPAPRPVSGYNPPAIANPDIVPVFLGAAWAGLAQKEECYNFVSAFLQSSYYQLLGRPYGIGPAHLREQPVVAETFAPAATPCGSSDVENALFDLGLAQTPGSTVFLCFLPPNMMCANARDGKATCDHTCGFHQQDSSGTLTYAVVPYIFSGCDNCKTFGRDAASAMMSAVVHELCEMLTNPAPGTDSAGYVATDGSGLEIADMCTGQPSNTLTVGSTTYNIQKLYINNVGCE